jgi:hypothetical protein
VSNFLKIGLGLIGIFILVIFFEITMDGFASLMGWTSGGSTIDTFTGLSPMVKISPMLAWLATLGASLWLIVSGALGLRKSGGGGGGGSSSGMH